MAVSTPGIWGRDGEQCLKKKKKKKQVPSSPWVSYNLPLEGCDMPEEGTLCPFSRNNDLSFFPSLPLSTLSPLAQPLLSREYPGPSSPFISTHRQEPALCLAPPHQCHPCDWHCLHLFCSCAEKCWHCDSQGSCHNEISNRGRKGATMDRSGAYTSPMAGGNYRFLRAPRLMWKLWELQQENPVTPSPTLPCIYFCYWSEQ